MADLQHQTHTPAGSRRLLNGEPRWLAPGATLRFTVRLAFRRWSSGTAR